MTLQQLRDFAAIVSQGGVRAAARALGVSQAGLTKSVAKLEASVQAELFVRTSHGVALTTFGERLLEHAAIILRECDRAESGMNQLRGDASGEVDIGVSPAPSIHLVPAVLPEFRRRFPRGRLHVTHGLSHSLLPAVRSGQLDIAITPVPEPFDATGLHTIPLFPTEPSIVGRRGHPRAHCRSIRELADCEWIVTGAADSLGAPGSSIVDLFAEAGLGRPNIAVVCDSLFDTLSLITRTDLLAPLPQTVLTHSLMREGLARIPIAEPQKIYTICIVHRASPPLSPIAAALTSMLVSYAKIGRGVMGT
ncbi:HTH-type transcriptional regulator TsaR [Paraburkholderia caffeinitolerans]|uniref:HTH-type transcriptional regulator TsaR n=1 Tax=Paraburkholderia caffeinitolerans TaxID=1723730 RepID=A0A6J5GH69_9BURK|nr:MULTISPECIES: LysR substrate-binding domain-containing protein [Paraburkholderia]CAB3798787.1 HTH-type transcriptional regulator TsaR [Paraburkholderia caffeinitolerans]